VRETNTCKANYPEETDVCHPVVNPMTMIVKLISQS